MMPAATSSSLNRPISASSRSLGITPASEFFVAFTMTMTRIVLLLPLQRDTQDAVNTQSQLPIAKVGKLFGGWELMTKGRTTPCQIDTAPNPPSTRSYRGRGDTMARLIGAAAYDVVALALATALSVCKPDGPSALDRRLFLRND